MYTRSVGVQRPPLLTCFKKIALVTASCLVEFPFTYLIRGDVEVFAVLTLEVLADAASDETNDIKDYILVSRICALNRNLMSAYRVRSLPVSAAR